MNCFLWLLLFALLFWCYRVNSDEGFYIPQNVVLGGAYVPYTADLQPPEMIPPSDYIDFHQLPASDRVRSGTGLWY